MNSRAVSASMPRNASPDAARPRSPGASLDPGPRRRSGSDLRHARVALVPLALETVGRPGAAVAIHGAVHLGLELLRRGLGLLPRPPPGPGPGQESEPERA